MRDNPFSDRGKKKDEVTINKQVRTQLVWWLLNMRALTLEGAFIPDPDGYFPRVQYCCTQMQLEGNTLTVERHGGVIIWRRWSMREDFGRLIS
jgi:hypothetical protein